MSAAVSLAAAGVPAVADKPAPPTELESAILWATGLPHPSDDMVQQLLKGLANDAADGIVKSYRERAVALASRGPARPATPSALTRRYKSTCIWQRLADAKAFAGWASIQGIDFRAQAGRKHIRRFLQAQARAKLHDQDLRRGFAYTVRCLELYLSGALVAPCRQASKSRINGSVAGRLRKRARGQPMLKDMLHTWFCSIRRSISTRIPPKLVLAKAGLLRMEYIEAHLNASAVADAPVISYRWLSRWKQQFGVSLRRPNRKWTAPGMCWRRGCA